MLDLIQEYFRGEEERPNKFTRYMGEKIKTAREEAGISQEKLAKLCYLRRATLSNIENGKSEADTQTFVLIAYYLKKPLAYFLPGFLYKEIKQEDLSPLEQEIINNFRHVWDEHLQQVAIDQVRVLSEFNPEQMIWNMIDIVVTDKEREERIKNYLEEHSHKLKYK